MENFSWVLGISGRTDREAGIIIDVVESIILFHSFLFHFTKMPILTSKEVRRYDQGQFFMLTWIIFWDTSFFWIAPFFFFFPLRNVFNSLPAVWIYLESSDNQLSKWENRMLVIMIIKLYETHPLRSNTHTSLSNILIKLWIIVTIRIKFL